ncbi:hypothetical protein ABB02_00559 [Clostridiaceae bacterium JG1575]|nr:hypothetical protein ABB02_00559 [Clostridiaceae bacterium JG1575]
MKEITFEFISDRPISIHLNGLKVQGALMMADMGGYLEKSSVSYDPQRQELQLTIKEKLIELLEQRMSSSPGK